MPTARRIAGLFAASAASALVAALATGAHAQDASQAPAIQTISDTSPPQANAPSAAMSEIVVTGTREAGQTQFTALSPVSVYSQKTVTSTITTNLGQTLAEIAPGFDVKRLPAADGPEFIQPVSLDGLSPDFTLVLLNGKRFHNSGFIEGSGNSAASQSSDLNMIPSFALSSIQVLTDGASAQYGSDAIAGVVNLILNTKPGVDVFAQGSQYYAGDGTSGEFGLRAATALPGGGHLMVTTEYSNDGLTSRTVQRPDAVAFQAANPQLNLANPVQRWGNPATNSWKYAFDGAEPIGDVAEGYIFGTMSNGYGIADINWRNPTTNASVYGTNPALGVAPTIFPGFNLNNVYPGGFTPREGTEYNDQQVDIGLRHKNSDVFTWDVSASYGHNDTGLFLDNSINASLGPDSPHNFQLGHYMDTDFDLNADFDYRLRTNFLPDPINIAFGAERRVETFEARSGDLASYEVGPGAAAGLAPGANGFPGINLQQAGTHSETSYAGYLDIQVPVTKQAQIEFAARDESFDLFGNTFNYKVAGRYELLQDAVAMRVSYSTGFKAPTPGQIFSTNTNQSLDSVTLQQVTAGRISPENPLAQALGAKPLTPETSTDIDGGLVWKTHFGLSGSLDLYQIDVANRLLQSPSFTLTPGQVAQLEASGVAGASAFTSVSFYTNAFSTATRGINLTSNYARHLGPGDFNLNGNFAYYNTQITGGSLSAATQHAALVEYEKSAPDYNATVTATYTLGKITGLGRMRYYGSWTDSTGNTTGTIFQSFPGIAFLDLEVTYAVTDNLSVKVGAENVGNFYPAKATNQANRGLLYSRNSPYDTNGGDYVVRVQAHF
ncbi:MAG: TonB-dependent receptor [Caulobacteraceae bacterium]